MTERTRWENLKREATQGQGIDRALTGLYEQGFLNGQVHALASSALQLRHAGFVDAALILEEARELAKQDWLDQGAGA